jgi:hypothetical protein
MRSRDRLYGWTGEMQWDWEVKPRAFKVPPQQLHDDFQPSQAWMDPALPVECHRLTHQSHYCDLQLVADTQDACKRSRLL